MKKRLWRECSVEDYTRMPNGSLKRTDPKPISRKKAHRYGFLNKSPSKRAANE